MHSTLLTTLALCLTLFNLSLAKTINTGAILTTRQTTGADPCLDYSITATHAIIGTNTTYRAAYYALSNVGTLYDARMLDAAIAKLPSLKTDVALNAQCGNQTEIKTAEAATNFTMGIVGPFSGVQPLVLNAGPIVVVVVALICGIFGATWMLMP
ncbi:hypothetical protein K504DRAFT_452140 [Pleomassaria siparia CBS 279.74]|uniref:Uncharacterized protein n=1 Tax=Pleomassaria siparia CBS 279.74 TaxID=1314801 RepID=A0A6G1JQL3_9PLEO|nr:hypothetical protein K504DRAFT_452140 [Pleomassaria siparia CBS 279.74]